MATPGAPQSYRKDKAALSPSAIRRILIVRPNHRLGNMLLITPLVEETATLFPEAAIDVFVKGGAAFAIFTNNRSIDRIIALPRKAFRHILTYLAVWIRLKARRYDLVINAIPYSSSGKLATRLARAPFKCMGEPGAQVPPDAVHTAKAPVYALRAYLRAHGWKLDLQSPVPPMDIRLTAAEKQRGKAALAQLLGKNADRPILALFTYATGAKCFSSEWWKPLYRQLQETFPDYAIMEVLPAENVSQIDFEAPAFYSRDLREIGGLLRGTALFVGADSGMMHLASASGARTLGLFSVTDADRYAPYGHGSRALVVKDTATDSCLSAITDMLRAPAAQ